MDIFSPKDGFVVELLVADGSPVKLGDPLLKMDTDDEDRHKERLTKMENVRLEMAKQYVDPELSISRRLAEIAVDLAKYSLDTLKQNIKDWEDAKSVGKVEFPNVFDYRDAYLKYNQELLNIEKSKLELQKFDFSVNRHMTM